MWCHILKDTTCALTRQRTRTCGGKWGDVTNGKECHEEESAVTVQTAKSVMGNILGLTTQMQRVWRGGKRW